jgi:hypothetical protein
MEYLEFDVKVGAGEGLEYPVSVLRSPAGEASGSMTFPYDDLVLDNRLQAVQIALLQGTGQRRRVTSAAEAQVQTFGGDLFDALFTGPVRELYDASRQEAARARKGLRVRLRFEPAELAALPWEFAYDKRDAEYVCLSRTTPLVRYIELAQPQEPLAVALPLRVLVMIAGPSDLGTLDAERERARIEEALGPLVQAGRVELQWLEGQTGRDLQHAMLGGPWHVFHFVGHGGFDRQRGEGTIAVCDEHGAARQLGATDLGRLLGDHESLRMAVLNACEGATADRADVFSSTAAVLVRRGTPAVIAMQYEITDQAAVELSRSFYAAVATGVPVDVALTEARKAVAMAAPGTLEWATPVLYLRAPEGRLFDIPAEAASEPPAVPPVAMPPVVPEAEPEPDQARTGRAPLDGTVSGRKRGPIVAGIAVVVAALVGLGIWLLLRDDSDDDAVASRVTPAEPAFGFVNVPDVFGRTLDDGIDQLEFAGFFVARTYYTCSSQPAETVRQVELLGDEAAIIVGRSGDSEVTVRGPFEEGTEVQVQASNGTPC